MDQLKASEIANQVMQYLWDNGWNKTLKLIKDMQNKDASSAKIVLKRLEDLIVSCKNGDFMYYFARDIEGADLGRVKYWLEERLKEDIEFYGPNKKEFAKLSKYVKDIEHWMEKRKKPLSASDILGAFDDQILKI